MKSIEKIAYIVPSEAMMKSVQDILKEEISAGVIDVLMIDVSNVESEYRKLCDKGYSCIVARGGTFSDLKKHEDLIPVVEERIRTSDILEVLAENTEKDESAFVVLHQNTADGAENFSGLSKGELKVLRYRDLWDLRRIISEIPESNVKVFTSGYAATLSDRDDLDFIVLKNRPHTVRETVKNARVFLSRMQDNIQQVNTLNSIYNNIDEGIILFDNSYRIIEGNDRASSFLGKARHDLLDENICDLIPEMPKPRNGVRCSMDSPRTFMGQLGKQQMSYTVYPFEFYRGETRFILIMQDVTKIQTLERNIRLQLTKKGLVAEHHFEDIMTCDPVMEHVIGKARSISAHEGSVLIYGESGTGKELFAQSIHNESKRRSGPFVAINCAALTESLLESELFGYVGGAFTGARKEGKAGLFELAHNGTIFLDEINSTPPSLQAKILRVIESQQVMRVGSDYVIPLNVRVISACNSDLNVDIEEGKFRRDLYYRLNTFELIVPPVRERKSDILMLFRYYAAKFSDKPGIKAEDIVIDHEFETQLLQHSWRGNVREIRSIALRYNAFGGDNSAGDILSAETGTEERTESEVRNDTAAAAKPDAPTPTADPADEGGEMIKLSELSNAVEQLVIQSLEQKGLSRTDIAKALGISRQALYKKMNK